MFKFECHLRDEKQDRTVDHASHVTIRNLIAKWEMDAQVCLPKRPTCKCMLEVDGKLVGMKLKSHCCYQVTTGCNLRVSKHDIAAGAYLRERQMQQSSDVRAKLEELNDLPKIVPIPRNWDDGEDMGLTLRTPVVLGPEEIGWPKVATVKKKPAAKTKKIKQVAKAPAAKKINTKQILKKPLSKQFEKKPETVP